MSDDEGITTAGVIARLRKLGAVVICRKDDVWTGQTTDGQLFQFVNPDHLAPRERRIMLEELERRIAPFGERN